jgi:hypothetical protein
MKNENEVWEFLDVICKKHAKLSEAIEAHIDSERTGKTVVIKYAEVLENHLFVSRVGDISMELLVKLTPETIERVIVDIISILREDR